MDTHFQENPYWELNASAYLINQKGVSNLIIDLEDRLAATSMEIRLLVLDIHPGLTPVFWSPSKQGLQFLNEG
jgi:hypothetical protein